jgi:hypothetical protein
MVAKKGNGVFILVVSLIVLVGGGVAFFLYRKAKKGQIKDEVSDEGIKTDEVITPSSESSSSESSSSESSSSEIPSSDSSSSSSSSSSSITDNPFKSKDDLKDFQKWILKYHETDGTFGKGSATPVGTADGLWGKKSAKAWDKYGSRYKEVTNVVVNKPKPIGKPSGKPKGDSKPQKVDEDAKLKLGSDNSNVSAIKQIMNQVALWTGVKSKNGVNFPLKTDDKFTQQTDKVVSFFFPKYKSNGYVTRKEARLLWSYTAGLKNKTFPSALVGNKDESSYKAEYKRGKEKSKKKFASFGEFAESKDNFSEFSDDQENFS